MVARGTPGVLLGFFVVAGTVTAALAVRPTTGRMLLPVPVLSYLVAALITGIIHDPAIVSSKTQLAVDAAQWIADGFFAMALATVLAAVITAARWYLWRRRRPAPRAPRWPVPPAGTGRDAAGRDATERRPADLGDLSRTRVPQGLRGSRRRTGNRPEGDRPQAGRPQAGGPQAGQPQAGQPQAGRRDQLARCGPARRGS